MELSRTRPGSPYKPFAESDNGSLREQYAEARAILTEATSYPNAIALLKKRGTDHPKRVVLTPLALCSVPAPSRSTLNRPAAIPLPSSLPPSCGQALLWLDGAGREQVRWSFGELLERIRKLSQSVLSLVVRGCAPLICPFFCPCARAQSPERRAARW
jgi:hypothetical protein